MAKQNTGMVTRTDGTISFLPISQPPPRGHWALTDYRGISQTLVGQLAVLGVSTANAVTVILAEDLHTVQASTAQMGVLVVGLCRKHKVLSQSNSHEDTL